MMNGPNGWSASMSGWEWTWMLIGLLALCVLATAGVVVAARYMRRGTETPAIEAAPRLTAQEVLADRFARGEIGEDEYWQRLHVLRATND